MQIILIVKYLLSTPFQLPNLYFILGPSDHARPFYDDASVPEKASEGPSKLTLTLCQLYLLVISQFFI